jgi:deaminated glutathione amidase
MTSINDAQINLGYIVQAIEKLDPKTRLICLPENSLYLNLDKNPITKDQAFHKNSPEILELQNIAVKNNLFIHLGGTPWLKNGHIYNEAIVISDKGELIETYEKIHLFDVNLGPDIQVCESATFKNGERLNTFEIDGWKFATCICYDVRFPELFIHYMENEKVDAFIIPAAFTTKTGEIHWKTLLTARAIETQAYVLAAGQVGYHRDLKRTMLRKSWGQSLIISPWGRILQETSSYKDFSDSDLTEHDSINTVLERSEIEEYRRSIPVSRHRYYKMELTKK